MGLFFAIMSLLSDMGGMNVAGVDVMIHRTQGPRALPEKREEKQGSAMHCCYDISLDLINTTWAKE